MADEPAIEVTCRLAWWFEPYLTALIFLCRLLGTTPDPVRLERMVYRALRFRVGPKV